MDKKRCTTNRENRSLMRLAKQNQFKNLGELHKEWTDAGVCCIHYAVITRRTHVMPSVNIFTLELTS